jgi:hypothetical protein
MKLINLQLGGGGENSDIMYQSVNIFLSSNFDLNYINTVIEKANLALGYNIQDLCSRYQEDYIAIPLLERFYEYCGDNFPKEIAWDTSEEAAYFPGVLTYVKIIIAILNTTEPKLCLDIVEAECLRGFGYGLYS